MIARRLSFILALALALAALPEAAYAQQADAQKPLAESLTGMSRADYEAAKILYADGDFANAIVKFEAAYESSKDARLLWNVAVCQKKLRRYSRMLGTLRRYRAEAGARLSDEQKRQADEIEKTVETFVSAVRLTVDQPGAEIFVDDERLGVAPLADKFVVDVGVRKFRVSKRGFKDAIVSKEIPGGGEIPIDVRMEKEIHKGRLLVTAGAEDLIAIDGHAVAKGRWDGLVTTGGHTLRVTAPGMAAHQSEAVVQDNQLRRIDVALNPLPKDTTRTVLWIVAGTALATGAAVGAAFLFKPAETPPVQGNISPFSVQLSRGGHR